MTRKSYAFESAASWHTLEIAVWDIYALLYESFNTTDIQFKLHRLSIVRFQGKC